MEPDILVKYSVPKDLFRLITKVRGSIFVHSRVGMTDTVTTFLAFSQ